VGYDFELDGRDARVTPARSGAGLLLEIDGLRLQAALEPGAKSGEFLLTVDGRRERLFIATRHDVHFVHWRGRSHRIEAWNALDRARQAALRAGGAEEIRAPMPGVVVGVAAVVGAEVEPGAVLLTIESMKLQTAITATHAARVAEICVAAGDHFDQGAVLIRLEAGAGEKSAPAMDAGAGNAKKRKKKK
jgi:biotin carboxyl carrier protein